VNDSIIAPCGIECDACDALIATLTNNNQMREEMAAKWSTPEQPINPSDIACLGCLHPETHIAYADKCPVRRCVVGRGVETCAHCSEYPCETLEKHWECISGDTAQAARETLDGIHASLKQAAAAAGRES